MSTELKKLNEKLKFIDDESEKRKNKLRHDYVVKNRRFAVGDVIKSNVHAILVDKIAWSSCSGGGAPFSVYMGKGLTKKLIPRKDGERFKLYGEDVVKLKTSKGE